MKTSITGLFFFNIPVDFASLSLPTSIIPLIGSNWHLLCLLSHLSNIILQNGCTQTVTRPIVGSAVAPLQVVCWAYMLHR